MKAAAEEQSTPRIQRLLNDKEAADVMGISANTLAYWRATKKYPLKFIVCGGSIRYRLSDIEEFLAACTVVDGITPPGVVRHPAGPGRPPKRRRNPGDPPSFLLPNHGKKARRSA